MLTQEQKDMVARRLEDEFAECFLNPLNECLGKVTEAISSVTKEMRALAYRHECYSHGSADVRPDIDLSKCQGLVGSMRYRDEMYTNGDICCADILYRSGIQGTYFDRVFDFKPKTPDKGFAFFCWVFNPKWRNSTTVPEFVKDNANAKADEIIAFKKMLHDPQLTNLFSAIAGYAKWYTERWSDMYVRAVERERANDNLLLKEFGIADADAIVRPPVYTVTITRED